MAGTRASIQVLLVLTVLASHEGRASPAGGLGALFSNRGSQAATSAPSVPSAPSAPSFNPLSIPQQIYSTFVGPQKPSGAATPAAAPHHVHHHETTTTVTKRTETSSTSTTTTTTTTTTTGAPSAAPPTKAAAPASSSTSAPAKEDSPVGERMSETGSNPMGPKAGAYSEEQLRVCREKWLELYNGTANEDIDILAILLENGGFPGQLNAIEWKQNATESGRWDYFVGDTDYKTFIRIENGTIMSQRMPIKGATPNTVKGEIYWSPPDFCGKLRHAKYELKEPLGPVEWVVSAKLCYISDSNKGKTLRCSNLLDDRAPLGPSLIAALVG